MDEARRRRDREEILLSMSRILDQIKDEREAHERKVDQSREEVLEQVERMVEQNEAHAQKIEEKVTRIQRETLSTLHTIEDKVDSSIGAIEKKVDLSSKAMQTMTTVAIFGFVSVTIAVMVLFFALLSNL